MNSLAREREQTRPINCRCCNVVQGVAACYQTLYATHTHPSHAHTHTLSRLHTRISSTPGMYAHGWKIDHFMESVRKFTRPTMTIQTPLHQWYTVLWIWWGRTVCMNHRNQKLFLGERNLLISISSLISISRHSTQHGSHGMNTVRSWRTCEWVVSHVWMRNMRVRWANFHSVSLSLWRSHSLGYCSTLQHIARYCTRCNTLQHSVVVSLYRSHSLKYSNTLQHAATRCNRLGMCVLSLALENSFSRAHISLT